MLSRHMYLYLINSSGIALLMDGAHLDVRVPAGNAQHIQKGQVRDFRKRIF